MSNHNILQENKQSRLMDTVDKIDARFPNLDKVAKRLGGGAFALGILVGGGIAYNELGPRTPVDDAVTDIPGTDFGQARNLVLDKTEKIAEQHGIDLGDVSGVTDTTYSLLGEHKVPIHTKVQLSKKPFTGYVVSAETTSSDPTNIPSLHDQQK